MWQNAASRNQPQTIMERSRRGPHYAPVLRIMGWRYPRLRPKNLRKWTRFRMIVSTETLQLIQLGNSFFDDRGKGINLVRRITSSAKSIANLLRGELRQQRAYPFGIFAGNMLADPPDMHFMEVVMQDEHVEQGRKMGIIEINILGRD